VHRLLVSLDRSGGEAQRAAHCTWRRTDVQAVTVGLERLRFAVMFAARFQ